MSKGLVALCPRTIHCGSHNSEDGSLQGCRITEGADEDPLAVFTDLCFFSAFVFRSLCVKGDFSA